jgi:hypothetical protein
MRIITCLILFVSMCLPISRVRAASEYRWPWPGILPDQKYLYGIKTIRNKLIGKMLITSNKKIEYNLLMSDKTLYASLLLLKKGNTTLASETALKGENYFSELVKVYAVADKISPKLDTQIDQAYEAHQEIIASMHELTPNEFRKIYEDVDYFSDTNYRLINEIRGNK